ncbi:PP2C family protein-serine/threonine phosphatase [Methanoregula sp. UBA64]|jgi:phosphoserine phosphatase RsbU/P|uniref:PP2C family protein-serine/threonine phosphatase n=1 Tax=Methanoregula sp. UBA64 TaxID=1915554 RepID=UPI0025CD0047|nr:SpoIIE family protein phosphatase [Methanoregula sp. UBA64]
MADSLLPLILAMIQLMCVIIVAAYLLTRSKFFASVLEGHPVIKVQVILIVFFGALSVYGTMGGIPIMDAVINVRDLGPIMAGLLGGPLVGLGAGLIGAAYRASLGGFTMVPCIIATLLSGLFGGIIWLLYRRKFAPIHIAVIFAVLMESLHMVITLIIAQPFSAALALVETIWVPMAIANALGVLIFAFMIRNLESEKKMQAERDTLVKDVAKKNTELAIAAEIQQSFLPKNIPKVEGFDVAGKSVMAKEVGGDFFDVIPFEVVHLGNKRMGILIADVSGKGVPAALFMALSRIIVRVNATWHRDEPAQAIYDANNLIAADATAGMFVTLFYGILDHEKKIISYVNAGHNPPMVYHAADRTISELEATGLAMGAIENTPYQAIACPLSKDDVIVLYTDGITEANNEQGEMYGEERLTGLIRSSAGLPATAILDAILADVNRFCGSAPQYDDITLMVIRVE